MYCSGGHYLDGDTPRCYDMSASIQKRQRSPILDFAICKWLAENCARKSNATISEHCEDFSCEHCAGQPRDYGDDLDEVLPHTRDYRLAGFSDKFLVRNGVTCALPSYATHGPNALLSKCVVYIMGIPDELASTDMLLKSWPCLHLASNLETVGIDCSGFWSLAHFESQENADAAILEINRSDRGPRAAKPTCDSDCEPLHDHLYPASGLTGCLRALHFGDDGSKAEWHRVWQLVVEAHPLQNLIDSLMQHLPEDRPIVHNITWYVLDRLDKIGVETVADLDNLTADQWAELARHDSRRFSLQTQHSLGEKWSYCLIAALEILRVHLGVSGGAAAEGEDDDGRHDDGRHDDDSYTDDDCYSDYNSYTDDDFYPVEGCQQDTDNEGDELNEIEADDAAFTDGFDEYDLCLAPTVSNAYSCCVSCSCSSHLLRQRVLFSRLLSNDFAPRL